MGQLLVTGCYRCSRFSSDAYDIYYGKENPGLLPTVHADPAEYDSSDPWTLDDDHGDATVEDICDFIINYIQSDVMVCSVSCLYPSVLSFT
jgi:RNA-dependent RNA polymerase